jgi:hypothetical protein
MNQYRVIKFILLFVAGGFLVWEWTWDGAISFYIRSGLFAAVPMMLLPFGFWLKAFNWRVYPSKILFGGATLLIWFLLVILIAKIGWSSIYPTDLTMERMAYYVIFLVVGYGLLGFRIGMYQKYSKRFFEFCAAGIIPLSIFWTIAFIIEKKINIILPFPFHAAFPVGMLVIFSYVWYLFKFINEKKIRITTIASILVTLFNVFYVMSKPIVFMAIVCTIVILLLALPEIVRHSGRRLRFMLVIILPIIFIRVWMGFNPEGLENYSNQMYSRFMHADEGYAFSDTDELLQRASGGRTLLWSVVNERFMDSPIVGAGFGQVEETTSGEYIHFHNGYIDLLLSVGILGVIPLLVILIRWLKSVAWPILRRREEDAFIPIVVYIFGVFFYNFGGMSRVFIFHSTFVALLACILSGHVIIPKRRIRGPRDESALVY